MSCWFCWMRENVMLLDKVKESELLLGGMNQKMMPESGFVVLSYGWRNVVATADGVMKNRAFFHYKPWWYNSSHANEYFGVELENKSLDYWPLMDVVNQQEANSPLMSMSAKVPKYILRSANKWSDVEPLARSNDQGTLMYSHDCRRENLSLGHTSLKVLNKDSSLYPR